jgi:hypothetical protein
MASNLKYRYVALTPEHTTTHGIRSYGTASLGASARIGGEADSESIQYQFDLLTRADMSHYGAQKSVNGKEYSSGSLDLVMQPDDFLGLCIYGIYGDNTSSPPDSAGYVQSAKVHTFKEASDQILPSFTLEVGREEKEHTYTGMCVESLSFSASHGEYATISASLTGKSESALATLANPTLSGDTVDGFHFAEGVVSFSTAGSQEVVSTRVQSISLDFNMNLDTDAACSIGSRTYLRQPLPQMREISGSVEFSTAHDTGATDDPAYDTALATGGAIFDGDGTFPALKLKFVSGTSTLEVQVQKLRWEAPTSNVSGRDTETLSMSFVGLLDQSTGTMSKMILTNTGNTGALTGKRYSEL